ncbi:MAG: hypothetical protein JXA78_03860 [Anaerolineales bacterium]|nr:hypothetical protein [Anaerolineales bacterium]
MLSDSLDETVFQPERRPGYIFQAGAIVLFVAAGFMGLWQAAQAEIGPVFLLYLLPALLAVVAVPALAYRFYALNSSYYALERDGIRLRWGLRYEDIPMTAVLWVHPASDLATPNALPLPRLRWPGSVLGVRNLQGLGPVEFMAASSQGLMLIATLERSFAISPVEQEAFLHAFQRYTEMGSLTPLEARSIYPTFLVSRVWASAPARALLLAGFTLSLVLLIWVSLAIPWRTQVILGFDPAGGPGDAVPAVRLLLLPVINSFFVLADLFLGLFFYRRPESQPLSYLLWGSGAFTPLLFLIAVFFILRAG